MRFLYGLWLSSILMVAAGCSADKATPYLPPNPAPTTAAYQPGAPVQTKLDAVIAGRIVLERPGFNWLGSPRAVLVEEMSYAEANRLIGLEDGPYDVWPRETRVWLVIFEGQWQVMPMGPPGSLPVTYEGCLRSLFTASDGRGISMGDAVCPVQR